MLKFQVVAEKTAKNFRGLLFCRTLYIHSAFKVQINMHVISSLRRLVKLDVERAVSNGRMHRQANECSGPY